MDTYRAFLAIIISFVILVGYQYFFVGFDQPAPVEEQTTQTATSQTTAAEPVASAPAPVAAPSLNPPVKAVSYDREPKNISIETELYRATLSEDGGMITSFVLKNYKETHDADSLGMQLVKTDKSEGFPLLFSWGSAVNERILYSSDVSSVKLTKDQANAQLVLTADAGNGLTVVRTYTFNNDTYLLDLGVKVINASGAILQGVPQISLVNKRFEISESPAKRFLFAGPAAYISGQLNEVKASEFEEGPKVLQGAIDWAGYGSNYFLCAVVPMDGNGASFTMSGNDELARTQLAGNLDTIQAGTEKEYAYHVFFGPKKLKMLKNIGYNLDSSVNFGWFDVIAKPALWLLNTFNSFFHNYGIAIILVTVLFKAAFWPISQKGMKSMKNMQKLQPKMVKLKEKYKNDPTKMNQEVMNLYKTYKVNPLGGCLPMVLQIPVFFALYKVLLQSIELRHAPFMLWITDLSAPDRLYMGFDLPYLGGLPVLTLLMGASMFFQQKLSPTTADPTQAKIMMFLPVIFTFMFLNFASGLVLYWFVNNLLSILQQVLINRDTKKSSAAA
ncbi:membrane protein insertase YidC [Desulforhopalus sp. IMCC35007]|uniref:membrane protein insertase YidC n=1 Tax=Desulforhopalus sp. IMCC35007 TaxID=2569543 RepID=UPI0010ADE6C7|nr:membrane protein insertase YidC [Desulforhopalus sp. IMCC35007]TKB12217.1 membrane protein insertase YidC [Desulforhopalus sp. IMCC35007]